MMHLNKNLGIIDADARQAHELEKKIISCSSEKRHQAEIIEVE